MYKSLCVKKGKTHKFCTKSTDSLSKCNFLAGGPLCAGKEAILVIVLQTWPRKHKHPTKNWEWLNNELFWNFFLHSVLEILNRGKGAWWILARSVFHRWLSFSTIYSGNYKCFIQICLKIIWYFDLMLNLILVSISLIKQSLMSLPMDVSFHDIKLRTLQFMIYINDIL